jgi:hypothetical protein
MAVLLLKSRSALVKHLLLADKILGSGSIDEDGNQAPLGSASYILIPGTKSSPGDTGLRVPVQSLETLAVAVPGLSYIGNIAIAQIVKNRPDVEEAFRSYIGEGAFEELVSLRIPTEHKLNSFRFLPEELWSGFRDDDSKNPRLSTD